MLGFDFEEEKIRQEIQKLGAKRVLLQLPEGLKLEGPRLAKSIEKTGALTIISADPCYGSCDIAVDEAKRLAIELIVHFGHSRIIKHEKIPTIYVEAGSTISIVEAVEKALPLLRKFRRIGLATSVQHLQKLNQVKEILVRAEKTVIIGDTGQMPYPGQVSGCNYSNVKSISNEVEAYLFIGGGLFHALGIALSTSKLTVIADPYDKRAFSVNAEAQRILKQRWACIEEARHAKTIGVLIGLKIGQKRLSEALKVKELAEKHGKTAYLMALREIVPQVLLEFPSIDAYVNTACPRISLEASGKFLKPVITVNEFMVVSGELSWESMLKKGLLES